MEPAPLGNVDADDIVVVFVGPSLDRATVDALLPAAIVLPPICQGQLLSSVDRYRPAAVAIIDGEFSQSLSVWHKEILFVLGQGIRVFGASSMGALRAAECDVYGMVGVGQIYEWYRDGLVDDDEVALVHGSEDDGWRNLSWPMVNVRATVDELRVAGTLDDATADVVLGAAKSIYFGSRTEVSLAHELADRGRVDAAALARLVTTSYRDQKRRDAELLLEQLADGIGPPPAERRVPKERLGRFGSALRNLDTEVERPTGTVLRQQIVLDAALHEADFDELQERALDRALVAHTAQQLGYEPTADELALERAHFLARRGLTEASLPSWLMANDLDEERFVELLLVDTRPPDAPLVPEPLRFRAQLPSRDGPAQARGSVSGRGRPRGTPSHARRWSGSGPHRSAACSQAPRQRAAGTHRLAAVHTTQRLARRARLRLERRAAPCAGGRVGRAAQERRRRGVALVRDVRRRRVTGRFAPGVLARW